MANATADITLSVAELADAAFQSFCEDASGMFGVEVRCRRREARTQALHALRSHFANLAVAHLVEGEGTPEGTFHLLLDQKGLFILSGAVVMLPESRILDAAARGSLDEAQNLKDAATEVGNLLVGSWDRVFRKACRGHREFTRTNTVIGKPWENPGADEWPNDKDNLVVTYEMTVQGYPPFTCAAVFPRAMLATIDPEQITQEEHAAEEDSAAEVSQEKETVVTDQAASTVPPAESDAGVETVDSSDSETDALPEADAQPTEPEREPQLSEEADSSPVQDNPDQDSVEATASPEAPPADADPVSRSDLLTFLDSAYVQSGPQPQERALSELLRTPASQIMDKEVVWTLPDDTVAHVIGKMQQRDCGYVLVGVNGTLEGLVSNSNILGAVSLYLRPMFARWRRPEDDATLGVKVKWIMSRPVRTVRPDTTLAGVIECMRRCGARCLPVLDERGAVQGIVTAFDILLYVLEGENKFSWKGKSPQAPAWLI